MSSCCIALHNLTFFRRFFNIFLRKNKAKFQINKFCLIKAYNNLTGDWEIYFNSNRKAMKIFLGIGIFIIFHVTLLLKGF